MELRQNFDIAGIKNNPGEATKFITHLYFNLTDLYILRLRFLRLLRSDPIHAVRYLDPPPKLYCRLHQNWGGGSLHY